MRSEPEPTDPAARSCAQHNVEIHENLGHWQRKPLLREVYAGFYREIAARLEGRPVGPVVECGSGIGNLKSVLPDCLATDLFPNPWIDRTENVFALSFADSTVGALILFDVFHHLEYPGTALRELHRVLKPGGRLILFEPAAGLLGRFVLGLFHHEPLGFDRPITWEAPPGWDPNAVRYYAAQANAWRLFRRGEHAERLAGWRVRAVTYFPALPWLLCGGFRGPQLCPRWLLPVVRVIERGLAVLPALSASRMLVVLEKVA
ncbi:MAG: class I SAM-dependent methyltransferase [Opitutaceae bacterium]|nr:class I SAM-dependent methyltransferase [Opitutaceae bacterium]